MAIVSVAVFEAKKEAHEKASKEGEKEPTVSIASEIHSISFYCRSSQAHIASPVARTSRVQRPTRITSSPRSTKR